MERGQERSNGQSPHAPTPGPTECPLCGRPGGPWEVDHKHPRSRGGLNTTINRWVICRDCNRRKANRTLYEFRVETKRASNMNQV